MIHEVRTRTESNRKAIAGGTGRHCLHVNHEIQHVAALSVRNTENHLGSDFPFF